VEPKELQQQLQGISSIASTAFDSNQELDIPAMKRHLRFFVDNGITKRNGVVVVTGSTGECGAMSVQERIRVWDAALEEVGDELPVVAGVNHSNLREVIEMAHLAEKSGAAGIMAVSPYYYPPRADVVLDFYRNLSEATSLGIMLYNNTEVTHFDIPVSVLSEIADLENVVGIKECSPNFAKMEQSARVLREKLTVINGHGEFLEPMAAIAGTTGFISSTANFAPRIAVEMWNARMTGDYAKAKSIRDNLTPYLDLAAHLGAVGGEPKVLALLKYLAGKVGSPTGPGRNPVLPLSQGEIDAADAALKCINLA
jgi:4-hydroxy-tetrahydrodipicolinate synthase